MSTPEAQPEPRLILIEDIKLYWDRPDKFYWAYIKSPHVPVGISNRSYLRVPKHVPIDSIGTFIFVEPDAIAKTSCQVWFVCNAEDYPHAEKEENT